MYRNYSIQTPAPLIINHHYDGAILLPIFTTKVYQPTGTRNLYCILLYYFEPKDLLIVFRKRLGLIDFDSRPNGESHCEITTRYKELFLKAHSFKINKLEPFPLIHLHTSSMDFKQSKTFEIFLSKKAQLNFYFFPGCNSKVIPKFEQLYEACRLSF